MPELPEVTTTVVGLKKVLPGLEITDIWTDWTKMVRGGNVIAFKKALVGEKVKDVGRRAKNVLIHFSGNKTAIIHMKMTGHLLYGSWKLEAGGWKPKNINSPLADPYNRFIHLVFTFKNGEQLAFSDMRKFGKIALSPTDKLDNSEYLSHLGPEPLGQFFTLKKFAEILNKRRSSRIKTVLMDQAVIAGIGNIYSDEMLWLAGIHPESPVEKLNSAKIKVLYGAMGKVLRKGIDLGGDSMSDYRNIKGEPGKFQTQHNVYRMTGKPCRKRGCGGIILRKVIGGRSAHFCPVHQKHF